jgi:hypothetical protein
MDLRTSGFVYQYSPEEQTARRGFVSDVIFPKASAALRPWVPT